MGEESVGCFPRLPPAIRASSTNKRVLWLAWVAFQKHLDQGDIVRVAAVAWVASEKRVSRCNGVAPAGGVADQRAPMEVSRVAAVEDIERSVGGSVDGALEHILRPCMDQISDLLDVEECALHC